MTMRTYIENQNSITAFVAMIRSALPGVIEQATDGAVSQTAERALLARQEAGEDAFQIYLSNGSAYRFRVQQMGEAEAKDDPVCRECGTLTEVNDNGVCAECATSEWDRMSIGERRAWCTANKVHYPYNDKGPMTPAQLQYVSALLASHPFRWAKTMPRNPHEYTLRHEWADVGDDVFEEVVRMIREHGYTEYFGTYPWRMLNANGYKYWTYYNSFVEEVTVLNRKSLPLQERAVEEVRPLE